ncbi:hypothetical protein M0R04_02380 [Candidatus Dojkabacteria bacterium]|jgi:heat-inducible transcriptional repressor|nr:hypothetical protein [Candidatus Dojkabacteria bacterium]
MNITDRQKLILLAIINEFMASSNEVGSGTLVEKYDMDISSATIRSEMVRLMEQGFLEKSHISSGRLPTDQAIRLYVREGGSKNSFSAVDEALVRQGIYKVRFSQEELIKEILHKLVSECDCASFVFLDDMSRYFGVSSLMKFEELRHIEVLQRVIDLLEDQNLLKQVFSKYGEDEVSLLIGDESGITDLENCAMAFTKVHMQHDKVGHIGVIGSRRLNYGKVVPMLNTIRQSITSSLKGWK